MSDVYIAVDCGASSSRVMAGIHEEGKIRLEEIKRIETHFLQENGHYYWNYPALISDLKEGLARAIANYGDAVKAVGVDTWGVDYGLLDEEGRLLNNPYQYRDSRTDEITKTFAEDPTPRFNATGIQDQFYNTLNQLIAETQSGESNLTKADKLLFMPDLINYDLCGVPACEYSIASTGQILNPNTNELNQAILEQYNIPQDLFPKIIAPGTSLAPLKEELCGGNTPPMVVAICGHDTGAAYLASPLLDEETVFISSGTWSLLGLERSEPLISEEVREAGFTNEAGYNGSIRLLKNIIGSWMIQECAREWREAGESIDYGDLDIQSKNSSPWKILLNTDHKPFFEPGDMIGKINRYCENTGQAIPQNHGETIRAIQDSLALTYRQAIIDLSRFSGQNFTKINIVGGGSQSGNLNQLTASATGLTIYAGPGEATSLGNISIQMLGLGKLQSVTEARELIAASEKLAVFKPQPMDGLEDAIQRFSNLS